MRIALAAYLALFILIGVDLAYVFSLPLWLGLGPVLILGSVLLVIRQLQAGQVVLMNTLNAAGLVALLAVSITVAVPSWEIVFEGSTRSWARDLLPIFVASIGLYGAGLWIRGAVATRDDALDWLANFLSGPGLLLSLLTGLVLCAGSVLGLDWLGRTFESSTSLTSRFLERGIIPPTTILLFLWGVLLLVGKWWNTLYLRRAVHRWVNGSEATIQTHIDRIRSLIHPHEQVEDRLQFLWRRHDESFLIPRYVTWAVPVLGFIGTVLGISLAADGIRGLIASETGLSGLSSELGSAIAPLGIAFDTTLIALSLSVFLTLFLALVQRSEERTLTALERIMREKTSVYG